MGQYLSPGVYVEEVSSGSKPIAGVGTAMGAFLGIAQKGPIDKATLITSWSQFETVFGGFISGAYLAYSVYQFFNEGGASCFVVRTVKHTDPGAGNWSKTSSASTLSLGSAVANASSDGTWGDNLSIIVTDPGVVPASSGFKLIVLNNGVAVEQFDNLTMESAEDSVNNASEYIDLVIADVSAARPANSVLPAGGDLAITDGKGSDNSLNITQRNDPGGVINVSAPNAAGEFTITVKDGSTTPVDLETYEKLTLATAEAKVNSKSNYIKVRVNPLAGGGDGTASIAVDDFKGSAKEKTGLYAFDEIDEINNLCIPDMHGIVTSGATAQEDTIALVKAGLSYCENRGDVFFIADAPDETITSLSVKDFKMTNFNSSFGAMYYPWIQVFDPMIPGAKKFTPPCGAIAGVFARTDIKRGVHKAPAGTVDGYLRTPVALAKNVSKGEHDILNQPGINVIRNFPGQGICVWGARTLTTDAEWQYINIRRLFLFLEESIDEGTQWVVFEPNSPVLWGSVKRNLTAFLTRVWQSGALFGSTADEAFFVKVDSDNNPPAVRDAGQLIIEIGVAPVKPAEFVIIRISQKTLSA